LGNPIAPMPDRAAMRAEIENAYGWSIETGVPCDLGAGVHWLCLGPEDLARLSGLARSRESGRAMIEEVLPEGKAAIGDVLRGMLAVHMCDPDITHGPEPDTAFAWTFGYALAVEDSSAIGYIWLADDRFSGTVLSDPGITLQYDTLVNVYVTRKHRRRGVANRLLHDARERYPLSRLTEPFTPAGASWIATVAPDLLARHAQA
jgi:GNAT superfamily N-acetyltransferase